MEILLIEDEAKVLSFLESALKSDGHALFSCKNYSEAADCVETLPKSFDVVIMDRLLHGKDSIDLIAPLRKKLPDCRILILSAVNSSEEKAAALDLGADDYLSKPFSLMELSARLRALSRRRDANGGGSRVHVCRDLTIDPMAHSVCFNGRRLDLSQKEYLLLWTLAQNPGRVYNKFQLLDRVWDAQYDIESNVVEVTVKNLRRKIEGAGSQLVIENKRNVGYWIET